MSSGKKDSFSKVNRVAKFVAFGGWGLFRSLFWAMWGYVWAHVRPKMGVHLPSRRAQMNWRQVGPMLNHLEFGSMLGQKWVFICAVQLGLRWTRQLGPSWVCFGARLGLCWAMLGDLCLLGLLWRVRYFMSCEGSGILCMSCEGSGTLCLVEGLYYTLSHLGLCLGS